MSQLTPYKAQATARSTVRPAEPRWFWLVLIGGSIALHLVAVALIMPLVGRATRSSAIDAIPVDIVELPPNAPAPTALAAPTPLAPAASASQAPVSPAANQAPLPSGINAVPTLPQPTRSPAPPVAKPPPQEIARSPVPSPELSPVISPEPSIAPSTEPSPSATPESPSPQPTEQASTLPSSVLTSPVPLSPVPQSPTPQPSPSAPLGSTLPIDQAVPDVSQTLPIPSADPSQLARVQTSREAQPVQLVASLQAADIPPEQLENPPPDTIAQPTEIANGISSYSFVADPKVSSCIPEPAAASAIGSGTKVAVQVSTDITGKVIDTAVLQPSQNPSYDQLAVCLVQNWSFQPAIAAGLPVPSKALVVLVTIDRG